MALKYKRVLLKLSGEALAGDKHFGLDYPTVTEICKSITNKVRYTVENATGMQVHEVKVYVDGMKAEES